MFADEGKKERREGTGEGGRRQIFWPCNVWCQTQSTHGLSARSHTPPHPQPTQTSLWTFLARLPAVGIFPLEGDFLAAGACSEHVLDEPRAPHSGPAVSSRQKSNSPGMSCENRRLNPPVALSPKGVVLSVSHSLRKVPEGMGPRRPSSRSLGTVPFIGFLPFPSRCPISSWGVLTSPPK